MEFTLSFVPLSAFNMVSRRVPRSNRTDRRIPGCANLHHDDRTRCHKNGENRSVAPFASLDSAETAPRLQGRIRIFVDSVSTPPPSNRAGILREWSDRERRGKRRE